MDSLKETENDTPYIEDVLGCTPMYLDEYPLMTIWNNLYRHFKSDYTKHILQTQHMQQNCYNSPNLCQNGFSVKLEVYGEY